MGKFNQEKPGTKKNFSKQNFSNLKSDRPTMHQAICASCGNQCQVPFRPSGSKPVYCSQCFESNENSGSRDRSSNFKRSGKNSFKRSSNFENKQMFSAICDNCGDSCQVPFHPTAGKPIFCSKCFENKNDKQNSKQIDINKLQFENLNQKLDQILAILTTKPVKKEKLVIKSKSPSKKKK